MIKIFISFVVLAFSIPVFALTPGAVSTATGGSGRAAMEPVDGVLLNPAIVATLPTKFFSADYTPEQWGITISDNGREALFPAALAFVRSDVNDLKTQQLSLAVSYSYKKLISVGTTLSMLEYNQGINYVDQKYRQTAADLGFVYTPTSQFGVGFVVSKIASSKTDLNPALQKQQTLGLGLHYTYQNFVRFRFDVESAPENKTDRLVYMGGIETYMNSWIVFRLGYQNNNVVHKNYASTGLGFKGPQFELHYAYNSNVADNTEDQHAIDLGIPF